MDPQLLGGAVALVELPLGNQQQPLLPMLELYLQVFVDTRGQTLWFRTQEQTIDTITANIRSSSYR